MELSYASVSKILEKLGEQSSNGNWEWCGEYGEPGYHTRGTTPTVVLGDYWLSSPGRYSGIDTHPERGVMRGGPHKDGSTLRGVSDRYPRLFAQLESQGVELEWYDEWMIDYDNDKAYRTTGDSYCWEPSVALAEYDWLTPDSDITEWIEYARNSTSVCLTSAMVGGNLDGQLTAQGYARWESIIGGDDQRYEHGWHPGQTDTPQAVTETIRAQFPDADIVFVLDYNSQFSSGFGAYVKIKCAHCGDALGMNGVSQVTTRSGDPLEDDAYCSAECWQNASAATCAYCDRDIVLNDGVWTDPEATGDDSMWSETCDEHDTFEANHTPTKDEDES